MKKVMTLPSCKEKGVLLLKRFLGLKDRDSTVVHNVAISCRIVLGIFSTLIPGFISVHLTVAAILEWIRAHQLRFTSNEYLAMQATQANEHVLERKQIGKYESKRAQYQKEQLSSPC